MKFTISTSTLQSLVARSMKGASCNKMVPLTSLMGISLKDHRLTLLTTDSTNYLYVSQDKVDGEDFYVVVQTDVFSKLIARMTCDSITLSLENNLLIVQGNGKYSIELPLDEDGNLIVFPDPVVKMSDKVAVEEATVNLSTVRLILNTAKPSLATTNDLPCYTGYYVGDTVVATDTYKICAIGVPMLKTPVLISAPMLDLLDTFTEEKIIVKSFGDTIQFTTPDCTVFGDLMDTIDDYQIEAINGLLDEEINSSCKLAKAPLLQLLDRLSLFVSNYDKNGIYLTFTNNGVQVESKQANSVEVIPYMESNNFTPFHCCIDIEMFRTQVKSNTSDSITLYYGNDNAIKLADGNVTEVVALLEDDIGNTAE